MRVSKLPAGLIIFLILTIIMSGCGNRDSLLKNQEPVTIRFVYQNQMPIYQELAEQFTKENPYITVEILDVQGMNQDAIASGYVDAVRWDSTLLNPDVAQYLLPMDEFLSTSSINSADFFAGTLDAFKMEGTLVGVPAGINPYVMYASVKNFKQQIVSMPPDRWDLNDLVLYASEVNNTSVPMMDDAFSIGFCSLPESIDPLILTYLYGGQLFDRLPLPNEPTLNDPANAAAVEWIARLRHEYAITPDGSDLYSWFSTRGTESPIIADKCGLWLGTMADKGGLNWWSEWTGEAQMLPLPYDEQPFNAAYVDGYFILASSKYPQESWKWITYLLDHQESAGLMLPPLQSQVQSEEFKNKFGSDTAAVAENLPDDLLVMGAGLGDYAVLEEIVEIYLGAVVSVVDNDTDILVTLDQAQTAAEKIFNSD